MGEEQRSQEGTHNGRFRLTREQHAFLSRYARENRSDISKMIRAALDEYFERRDLPWPDGGW